jgi:hypothetical protein
MEATKLAYNATTLNAHQYKGGITEIDQSKMDIKFPSIPPVNEMLPIAIPKIEDATTHIAPHHSEEQ